MVFPIYAVTKATLVNTTQIVQTLQAETRDYTRNHYKTRVWDLGPHRINDIIYSDTFFASVTFIREYKCFQMFAFKNSKFDRLAIMHKEESAPEASEDCIRAVGVPTKMVIDNTQVLTSIKWNNINRRFCIATGLTISKH